MNKIETIEITEKKISRSSKTRQKTGEAFVGKDILELISVSMYVEPLTMYREYIQNATDSIDQAIVSGVLKSQSQGEIKVRVSQSNRSIAVRDNGHGIPSRSFSRTMLSFGASEKRGTSARGFRGVGRFSGLGYCQQLIFRSKAKGENRISEVEWDGRILKRLLADNTERLSISELVKQVAVFSKYDTDDTEDHFFEVELRSVVRMGNDALLNEELVKRYISQVCPVPYASGFKFKSQLEELMSTHDVSTGYQIVVEDDFSESAHIHRPYSDAFGINESEIDVISAVEPFVIEGVHGGAAAIGWIYQHAYKGLIPSAANIRGIRVRAGNTQIGEESLMSSSFPEPRFNSWSIGEIHILERKISPNGRRDNFDNNVHWVELNNKFSQYAKDIARVCRKNSAERNAVKQFNSEIQRIDEYLVAIGQAVFTKSKVKELKDLIKQSLLKAEKLIQATQLGEVNREKLAADLEIRKQRFYSAEKGSAPENDVFDLIPNHKAAPVKEVFDLIFECSPNKVVAKSLIDKIVDRYKAKYS